MEFTTHFGLQSQTTRLLESTSPTIKACQVRSCYPLWRAVSGNLGKVDSSGKYFSKLQFAVENNGDFKFELFSLHSPLLGESLLVSFPALSLLLCLHKKLTESNRLGSAEVGSNHKVVKYFGFVNRLWLLIPTAFWETRLRGCEVSMPCETNTQTDMLLVDQECHLHSKIRWFTEFCNSHYLSQLAVFFIDAWA